MLKKTTYFIAAGLLMMNLLGAEQVFAQSTPNNQTEQVQDQTLVTQNEKALRDLEQLAEKISIQEMQTRLQQHNLEDELYIKVNDNDVFLFRNNINNTSQIRQIIYLLPQGTMQHFYTNNKKTADSMYKVLKSFQSNVTDVNGYRVVTDRDKVEKNAVDPLYHIWCMKLKYTRVVTYAPVWGYPFGFGWDYWGWGHYSHYHGGRGHHRGHRR